MEDFKFLNYELKYWYTGLILVTVLGFVTLRLLTVEIDFRLLFLFVIPYYINFYYNVYKHNKQ
jgi:hypothetical protein